MHIERENVPFSNKKSLLRGLRRQSMDPRVPGSIPGLGMLDLWPIFLCIVIALPCIVIYTILPASFLLKNNFSNHY